MRLIRCLASRRARRRPPSRPRRRRGARAHGPPARHARRAAGQRGRPRRHGRRARPARPAPRRRPGPADRPRQRASRRRRRGLGPRAAPAPPARRALRRRGAPRDAAPHAQRPGAERAGAAAGTPAGTPSPGGCRASACPPPGTSRAATAPPSPSSTPASTAATPTCRARSPRRSTTTPSTATARRRATRTATARTSPRSPAPPATTALGSVGSGLNCKLLIFKSDLSDGSIAASIVQAADRGADAINMSFGSDDPGAPQPVRDAVDYANAKGVVLVAAADDQPVEEQGYPSNLLQPTGTGGDLAAGRGLTVTAVELRRPARRLSPAAGRRSRSPRRGRSRAASARAGIFSAFPGNPTELEAGGSLLFPGRTAAVARRSAATRASPTCRARRWRRRSSRASRRWRAS